MNGEDLRMLYEDRRARYRDRDRVGKRLRDVLTNAYQEGWRDIVPAGQDPVVGNLIWAAARTIAQRVGRHPRISVAAMRKETDDAANADAQDHEIQLLDDLDKFNFRALLPQAAYWLVTHDLMPLVVRPSPREFKVPVIECKDPLTCYPGTVWPHKPEVYDVLFAERMPVHQAARTYPNVRSALSLMEPDRERMDYITLGEYWDTEGLTVAILEPQAKVVDFFPSPLPGTICTFLGRGFSPDLDFHGQFDHVVPILISQAKLTSLVMALAERNVFAETNIFAELASNQTKYAWGPDAVNYFMPGPGARVEKSINNMSPQVFSELDRLERELRLGGGFPGQLSGEPVATIATGKGIEELTVTVDDNVSYWQNVLQDVLRRTLICYGEMACAMGSDGCKNYLPKGSARIQVRHLSSSDPAQTVGFLQKIDSKLLARRSVRERLDEVDYPEVEEILIETEGLRDALLKGIEERAMMPVEQGGMDPAEIAKIIRYRREGTPLEDVIEQIAAEKAQAAQMAQASGMGPGGAPSIQSMLAQAAGKSGPAGTMGLGEARTAERLGGQAPFAAEGQQAAGGAAVQTQMGGQPSMTPAGVPAGMAPRV
jgi:hypothetical protein